MSGKLTCPIDDCGSDEWYVSQLVPGELTLYCVECGHKEPLSEEWMIYHDYIGAE